MQQKKLPRINNGAVSTITTGEGNEQMVKINDTRPYNADMKGRD